jgi:hypothetical protein
MRESKRCHDPYVNDDRGNPCGVTRASVGHQMRLMLPSDQQLPSKAQFSAMIGIMG